MSRIALPDERPSMTHHFVIPSSGGQDLDIDGYITCGMYPLDYRLGEVFITAAKEGSFTRCILDALATSISIMLQYGIPLEVITRKFRHASGGACGPVSGCPERMRPDGRSFIAKSIIDYLAAYLDSTFPDGKWIDAPKSPVTE